ncbi:J domain-containing protein [Butyrivibrio sp. FCS014]|uniref:J domain-containing protein n=1 Tax=Butyrivibrio sp. FCS014 TaxID=1408304 RepID=UPI000467AD99|nr:J domain-containing protein [Butyrivibrio sp. FCS014]
MEERRNLEEIILNGTEDELAQLRVWLFKESVRLENQESALCERYARLEEEELAFKDRMDAAERKLENATKKLNNDKALFDQRLKILNNGFDQLNADKKKLESEFIRLEREKAYQREDEYDALDLLFRGVNSALTLKKRYKDLMKMFHPDNISGDSYMVQLINEEYSVLCRQYDISMKA